MNTPPINWQPPEPRKGFMGQWDQFIGPGATNAEQWLMLVPTLTMTLAVLGYAYFNNLGWNGWQYLVITLLAFDLTGGVVTNATNTTKRWYHRAGQTVTNHLGFTAVHFVHPLLVAWLFRESDWWYAIIVYAYLMIAALVIAKTTLYLQRPLAFGLYLGGLILSLYVFSSTPGLEWFLPFFYLKLLVCHLVKEAPFTNQTQPIS